MCFLHSLIHDSNDFVERSDKEAQREITFQAVLETISSLFWINCIGLIWWFKFAGKKLKLEYSCVWKRHDTISRVTGSWKRLKTYPLFKPTAVSSLRTPSYISEWLGGKRVNSNWSILTNEQEWNRTFPVYALLYICILSSLNCFKCKFPCSIRYMASCFHW